MSTLHNSQLQEIGADIAETDKLLIRLLKIRFRLAEEVAKIKLENGMPFLRPEIEVQRLDQVAMWAKERGISEEFARAFLHSIIGESCKIQLAVSDRTRLKSLRKKPKCKPRQK